MKTIKFTKKEILVLLDAIHEWKLSTYADSDSGKDSQYSPSQLKAMDSAEEVLLGVLNG
tara:strand:+ start:1466 stop:1642 length:177 start_codon:yes stop_codon:yes gene_type:complete